MQEPQPFDMNQVAQIGIERPLHLHQHFVARFTVFDPPFHPAHGKSQCPHRPLHRIVAVRFEACTQKRHSVRMSLQHDFIRMQRQMQFVVQKIAQQGDQTFQADSARIDNEKIVHIPPVMFAPQGTFDEVVESIQVDIAEKLRSQIADRKSYARRRFQQTFRWRQVVPSLAVAADLAIAGRVLEKDGTQQKSDGIRVHPFRPRPPVAAAARALPICLQSLHDQFV